MSHCSGLSGLFRLSSASDWAMALIKPCRSSLVEEGVTAFITRRSYPQCPCCTSVVYPYLHNRKTARTLLSDAEAGKDHAQQIVGRELARDFAQRVLGQAELFSQQIQSRPRRVELPRRHVQVPCHGLQGLHMALACDIHPLRRRLPARHRQELLAQWRQSLAGAGRNAHMVRKIDK